jgi:methyl-accepting chemotaxis protein
LDHVEKACTKQQYQDGVNDLTMFNDYDPYEQFQNCIAQTNDNTRLLQTIVQAHNDLDRIVQNMNKILENQNNQIQNLNTRLHGLEHLDDSK